MTEFNWSDPQFAASGEFIEWAEGVEYIGTVVGLDTHTFPESERGPARTVPKVLAKDDAGHVSEITCGKADLKKKMVAAKPGVGDRVKIECIGSTKTQVGTQLFFKVSVQKVAPVGINPATQVTQASITDAIDENPPF